MSARDRGAGQALRGDGPRKPQPGQGAPARGVLQDGLSPASRTACATMARPSPDPGMPRAEDDRQKRSNT
nr:hypothetical protein GCM10020093_036590 [Planobispora longispora]